MNASSLDKIERLTWNPKPTILDYPAETISLKHTQSITHEQGLTTFSLNGEWELIADGEHALRLNPQIPWTDAIKAPVPGTVHTALYNAGIIPDPMTAINDKIARQYSYKTWWYRKTFKRPENITNARLIFEGVCYLASFWLNGVYLGRHGGMFGGPEFDVQEYLQDENVLIVRIDNEPAEPHEYSEYGDYDTGWSRGVVINCVYGWHYACLPTRGIWAGVRIESGPDVKAERPFFATADLEKGLVDCALKLQSSRARNCEITICVSPKNFRGESHELTVERSLTVGENVVRLRFAVPQHKLWWPNGHGEQNLYTMQVIIKPENDDTQVFCESFGFRTIEMAPLPCGEKEDLYNWTFVINGRKIFMKGANWCTTDALLRLPAERYERFLTLAQQQHIQLLRSWGGGIMETDTFYELCDEKGIMVMQEWPICWDSERYQPMDELLETVMYTVPRLRNHPSLLMWCGGNESPQANSVALDRISRLTLELDSTRPYHRTEPYGGALHNYDSYWGLMDLDVTLKLEGAFIGEFGLASCPNIESVRRYVPQKEMDIWPAPNKCSFTHHMPIFNEEKASIAYQDIVYLNNHVQEFCKDTDMESWILGTQLAQATGVRHAIERNRTRWPESTGICYYKLTDVYPACSWSTIDYYGVPKLSYDVLKDSYAPLAVYPVFDSTTAHGLCAPVYLVDEANALEHTDWKARVTAYDESLHRVKCCEYSGHGSVASVNKLGYFYLTEEQTEHTPLLILTEIVCGSDICYRSFYWLNYRDKTGCLFSLPRTTLAFHISGQELQIKNTGSTLAVGVTIACPDNDTAFLKEDNLFCLYPGEMSTLSVSHSEGVQVGAWNADGEKSVYALQETHTAAPADGVPFDSDEVWFIPKPALIGCWNADEPSGSETYDSTHHHSLMAMYAVARESSPRGGNLLHFLGTGMGLITRDKQDLRGGFSWKMGIVLLEADKEQTIFANGNQAAGSYRLYIDCDGFLCFDSFDLGHVQTDVVLEKNRFYSLEIVHDTKTISFWVDEQKMYEHKYEGYIPSAIHYFAFGGIPGSSSAPFIGTLEKIRMYNYPIR